jgi:hypothetical protein
MIRYIGVRAYNNRLRLTISVYQNERAYYALSLIISKAVSKETYKEIVSKVLTKAIK